MDMENIKKLAAKIAGIAPVLGSVLGPGGAAAGVAISALAKAFGLGEQATPEELSQAIGPEITPETRLKILMAEQDFKLRQRDQDLEELKIHLADIQSARDREVKTTQATGRRDINLYVLAWVIMGGFIGLIAGLIVLQINGTILKADPLLTLLLGSLSTDAGMVVGYFFGSSKSSSDKTELLVKGGK